MNQVTALHRRSIELLDAAWDAERSGRTIEASELRLEAYHSERQAAELVYTLPNSEPSKSVLARSAATLALSCGKDEDAERIVCRSLADEPPESIADELRDLLEQIWFTRHLALRGVELSNDELQISLSGKGIGFGFAPTPDLVQRLEATNTLMFRTAERSLRKQYRESGPPTNRIRGIAQQYISVPRAASFAVTIRVGKGEQQSLAGISNGETVIDEMLDCLELFNLGDKDSLARRIENPAYLKNFVALAQAIAPDGEVVNMVGFTAVRGDRVRRLALRRTWEQSQDMIFSDLGQPLLEYENAPIIDVTGRLKFADSLSDKAKIKVQNGGHKTPITVPEGMMDDIVHPHWNHWVTIRARKVGKSFILVSIRREAEPE